MTIPQQHGLHIHTKYHWMSFMLAGFRPKATINGYEVPLRVGGTFRP